MARRGCLLLLAAALAAACASAPARPQAPQAQAEPRGARELSCCCPIPARRRRRVRHGFESPGASVTLDAARESTRVAPATAPTEPVVLNEREVDRPVRRAARGPARREPRHFTLFFKFESEELTDDSRRLVQDVLREVKSTARSRRRGRRPHRHDGPGARQRPAGPAARRRGAQPSWSTPACTSSAIAGGLARRGRAARAPPPTASSSHATDESRSRFDELDAAATGLRVRPRPDRRRRGPLADATGGADARRVRRLRHAGARGRRRPGPAAASWSWTWTRRAWRRSASGRGAAM